MRRWAMRRRRRLYGLSVDLVNLLVGLVCPTCDAALLEREGDVVRCPVCGTMLAWVAAVDAGQGRREPPAAG